VAITFKQTLATCPGLGDISRELRFVTYVLHPSEYLIALGSEFSVRLHDTVLVSVL
jgi:hypothetical protein